MCDRNNDNNFARENNKKKDTHNIYYTILIWAILIDGTQNNKGKQQKMNEKK